MPLRVYLNIGGAEEWTEEDPTTVQNPLPEGWKVLSQEESDRWERDYGTYRHPMTVPGFLKPEHRYPRS